MQAEQQGPGGLAEGQQQAQQLLRQAGIQAGQGFIGQHQLGLLTQQSGDRHPLALAAREAGNRLIEQAHIQIQTP